MFLANCLRERLKGNYLERDDENETSLFKYEPHPKNPKVLLSIKEKMKSSPDIQSKQLWSIPSQQLHSLDKKEWEKSFTLSKLNLRWKEKDEYNFELNYRKFPEDCALPGVTERKSLINDLKDPDILELKRKRWNVSTDAKEKKKPELKKTLLDINNGLYEFQTVPLKKPKIPEGTDSRDKWEIDGNIWNVSSFIDRQDIKDKDKEDTLSDKINTIKYWKKTKDNRSNEKPLPISEDRRKIELVRYYKKYRTPYQKTIDHQNLIRKVKDLTTLERDNVEKMVKMDNIGSPEKINALVFKKLYGIYRDKYNELKGKLPKEELKKRKIIKNVFKKKDIDLINKITAINKMANAGIFDNNNIINNYKKIHKNNTNKKLAKSKSEINTSHLSQSVGNITQRLLLPLVIKGNDVCKEEL